MNQFDTSNTTELGFDYPLVSVVIPAYNVESFISSCIDSICAQTYQNLEIIVIDDGSSDGTSSIARSSLERGSRPFQLKKQSNAGVSRARNYGISLAKGDYIICPDADDMLDERAIESLITFVRSNGLDAAFIGYSRVGSNDRFYHATAVGNKPIVLSAKEANEAHLLRSYKMAAPALLISKRISLQAHYREDINYTEDIMYVWSVLYCCNRVGIILDSYYGYRIRPGSTMANCESHKVLGSAPFIEQHLNSIGDTFCDPRLMYARWVLGTLHSSSLGSSAQEYMMIYEGLKAKEKLASMSAFPQAKARLAARAAQMSPRLFRQTMRLLEKRGQ